VLASVRDGSLKQAGDVVLVSHHTEVDRHNLTVLIVEDEAVSRSALSLLLSASGYRTEPVESAEEALRVLSAADRPNDPIVALVDLDLPGMNGVQLLNYLRSHHPDINGVVITAADRDRIRGLDRLGVPLLRKPLDFRHLLAILSEQRPQ
jgi:DNA-binding response OmpR family regulator